MAYTIKTTAICDTCGKSEEFDMKVAASIESSANAIWKLLQVCLGENRPKNWEYDYSENIFCSTACYSKAHK